MDARTRRNALLAVLLLGGASSLAQAQTTDGYHAIQVFPLVVDTASFTQRFHFQGASPWDYGTVTPTFYPARGAAQATPLVCTGFMPATLGETRFTSLRELCPGLAAGSVFGTLVLRSDGMVFAGASRVSNPAGAGLTVEAFPAHTFSAADTAVTGLRRLAAQGGQPVYQTNCFVGNLAELAPAGPPVATTVTVSLTDSAGALLGSTSVDVLPGELVRLLDVFAAAHVAAANLDNVVAQFSHAGSSRAGLISFCTVQDNTSYGADFRIGKQQYGWGALSGGQDLTAMRSSGAYRETPIDNEAMGAVLAIPPGASRNVHAFYFRHPDLVECTLMDADENMVTSAYGLEMRLRIHDGNGWRELAGGNGVVQFSGLYLGDKASQAEGTNGRYQLEVESNGQNEGVARPYTVGCFSGSGSPPGELIRKGLPTTF